MGVSGRLSTILPLTLLLAAAPLPAQEAPSGNGESAAEAEARATDDSSSEAPDAPATAVPENNDSPFDYESSEQISEDLSVSFPVDI